MSDFRILNGEIKMVFRRVDIAEDIIDKRFGTANNQSVNYM